MKRRSQSWHYPRMIERQYQSLLTGLVRDVRDQAREQLYPALPAMLSEMARFDAWPEDLAAIMDRLTVFGRARANQVIMQLGRVADQTSSFNQRQWQRIAKSAIGVDVFSREPWMQQTVSSWAFENSQLIKSIPDQMLTQVAGVAARGVRNGESIRDLTQEISERFNVGESRAELIARTEIGKLNGDMTKHRMLDVGVTKYIWATSGDERVRPEHAANEGKTFAWDDPPATGHPGQDFQCRCSSIPVFD